MKDINQETRDIYHAQHTRMLGDEKTRQRLMDVQVNEKFFKLPKGFFKGRKVLDAGCGSIARNAISFAKMGAEVHAMDIGDNWFKTARKNVKKSGLASDSINFINGNVIDIPQEDQVFDFVCCDGVLPHLADEKQVIKTLENLCKVTKQGGYVFFSYFEAGGLIETKLNDATRDFYKENGEFKKLIDNIKPSDLHELIDFVFDHLNLNKVEVPNKLRGTLKDLLDEDLCISIQNTYQCKKRECYDSLWINNILANNGAAPPKRLKRFIYRNNIRKFFSPFHYYHANKFTKILYGEGWIDCISKKTN